MEQLVNFIIRPPRAEYSPEHDLLDDEFMLKGKWYQRKDIEIKNSRGDVLKCTHYTPLVSPEGKLLPCVIYCHGNSFFYGIRGSCWDWGRKVCNLVLQLWGLHSVVLYNAPSSAAAPAGLIIMQWFKGC